MRQCLYTAVSVIIADKSGDVAFASVHSPLPFEGMVRIMRSHV